MGSFFTTGTAFLPTLYNTAPIQIINGGISTSLDSNALTITLTTADGTAPSTSNPVTVIMTDPNRASSTASLLKTVSITSALTLTISSGSTLGHASAVYEFINVYIGLNISGDAFLAVKTSRDSEEFNQNTTTTAEGGAGGADSRTTLYSTSAQTGPSLAYLGTIISNQATAGTWASNVSVWTTNLFQKALPLNELWLTGSNGFGSDASNKIPRYTTTQKNINSGSLSGWTYTDSATAGMSITIKREMKVAVSVTHNFAGSETVGISLNASSLTTAILSLAQSEILASQTGPGSGSPATANVTLNVYPGDIIRAHMGTAAAGGSGNAFQFRITELAY